MKERGTIFKFKEIKRWLNEVHERWKFDYLKKQLRSIKDSKVAEHYLKAWAFRKIVSKGNPHLRFEVSYWNEELHCEDIWEGGLKKNEVIPSLCQLLAEGLKPISIIAVTEYWKKGDVVDEEIYAEMKVEKEAK